MVIPIEPVPAARPRVSRWGTYYPPKYTQWKKAATEVLKRITGGCLAGPVALVVEQVLTKPRTSKLSVPQADIDNYLKGPMDALTQAGTVWSDDRQVVAVVAVKRFSRGKDDPAGTRINVMELDHDIQ